MNDNQNFVNLKENLKNCLNFFAEKLSSIRSNRVTTSLVENIMVECYGSMAPLKTMANLVIQPPNVIIVEPWDPSILNDISKSIETSNLGVNPQKDVKFIRLVFPSLTQERRDQLIKLSNSEKEACRIEIKKHRETFMKKIQGELNDKVISEDDKNYLEKEGQKEIDKANENADILTDKKIAELKEF